jgi:hypothetical protein
MLKSFLNLEDFLSHFLLWTCDAGVRALGGMKVLLRNKINVCCLNRSSMKNCFSLHVGLFIFLFLVFPVRAGLNLEKNLIDASSIDEIETYLYCMRPGMGFIHFYCNCSKIPESPCREQ